MKRVAPFLFLLASMLYPEGAVEPFGGVEVSVGTDSLMIVDGDEYIQYKPLDFSLQVILQAGVLILDRLEVSGEVLTKSDPSMNDTTWLDPYQAEYTFTTAWIIGEIELGMRHSCFHPIRNSRGGYQEYYGGGTRFYGRVGW